MLPGLLATAGLISIHLLCHKLHFLERTPRSIWLSGAGGISVAYVFLHLLPELEEGQRAIEENIPGLADYLAHHSYLIAFLGLILFYGVEHAAKRSTSSASTSGDSTMAPAVYVVHLSVFAIYKVLIGYLLGNAERDITELVLFFVAMALHFLVADFGLRDHYKNRYAQSGRWVLCVSVFLGWLASQTPDLSSAVPAILTALLGGGIIFNVFKEELPEDRSSRFSAFLIVGLCCAALLLAF
ncbi:hypothetical protein F0A17_08605 [Billgrantia pellis]|uniref:ZIP family metal transporter n=1 Tax=Billgrantia pellis TaxID=2606936 RepID=A0A7V7G0J2_9GAMM|nr:hypothetical protein [Halomonas pellis]KAA0012972.1 hypothetical protein F0A17_08605 [Halomonas pellis]